MSYDFVEAHRERWPARTMCRVPLVSAGGNCDRRGKAEVPEGATT